MERLPESRVQMEITADEQESADAWQRAARKVGNQLTVPGFRKGKAPRSMIERLYGPEIFEEEAHRFLMTDLYRRALEQEDVVPVGDPEVDIVSTDPLSFTVIVPVYPDVDPGAYQDVRIEPRDASVSEAEVDELLNEMRKANSPWVDAASEGLQVGAGLELTPKSRHPQEGDQVTIDYTVQQEGEAAAEPEVDAVFVLGESGLLAPIEDAIKGLRVGESTGFSVTFDADDETVDEELRGKTLSYTVTLKGIKERDLIPFDDDFAKAVSEFETLDELRADMRERMHRSRTAAYREAALAEILSKMAEGATIDVPAPMVERLLEDYVARFRADLVRQGLSAEAFFRSSGMTEDDYRNSQREGATTRLRNSLLLRKIAEQEGITVADAEVDEAVERLAGIAEGAEHPQRVEAFARSDQVREMLEDELADRKLWDRLVEIATEGGAAVVNGWTPPAVEPDAEASGSAAMPAEGEEPVAVASESAASESGAP
jgi:trigger factor